MLRSLLPLAVLVLAPAAAPQGVLQPRAVDVPVRDGGTLDWASGTWSRTGLQSANLLGATTIYNNTCNWTGGAFFATGGTCFDSWDDGRIPTTDPNDPTLATAGLAPSYTICGWQFGYCTAETTPQSFFMSFSAGTVSQGVGGQCAGPFSPLGVVEGANAFFLSGLPPSTAFDQSACWLITIDLGNSANQFSMNGNDDQAYGDGSDNFAWSWRLGQQSLAPTNPTGQFLAGEPSLTPGAGTFDIPSTTDPITGGPCGNGMDAAGLDNGDLFWINTDVGNPCGALATGCYFFGGWPGNPAGGFYLALSGIPEGQDVTTYCTAKPSDALGCIATMSASCLTGPIPGANDFSVTVSGLDGFKPGIFFGGINGQAALPFLGGTLCFFPPIKRGAIQFSGGTPGVCDGTYSEVINTGLLFPAGFDAGFGGSSWMQAWYRSPCMGCGTGFDIGLSDGLEILNWGGAPCGGGGCGGSFVNSSPASQSTCTNTSAVFNANGSPGGGTYSWSINPGGTGSFISGGQGTSSITVQAGGSAGTASVTVTYTPPGCPAVQDSSNLTVQAPSVSSTPSSQTACINDTANFNASGSPGGGTYSWSINPGGTGSFISGGQNSPNVTVTTGGVAGNASLTVTYTAPGCAPVQDSSNLTVDDRGPCDNVVEPGEDIQSVIDNAPPGSLIEVLSGSYSGFVVDGKPLTIMGNGDPQITGLVCVENLAPTDTVALSDFEMGTFDALSNNGCVIVSGVRFSEDFFTSPPNRSCLVDFRNSVDVRATEIDVDILGQTTGQHGIAADAGRVELAEAVVLAANGSDSSAEEDGAPAGFGLLACNGTRTHLALSSLTGGLGGLTLEYGEQGGDGGHGIQVEGSSELILAGTLPGTRILGGNGSRTLFGYDGRGGDAVSLLNDELAKSIRWSGVDLDPGDGGPSAEDGELIGGDGVPGDTVVNPADDDPSLELLSLPQNNVQFTLRVHAKVGTTVDLLSGTQPQVLDDGLAEIELLVVPTLTQPLGPVPPGGFIDVPVTLATGRGSLRFYQAEVTDGPILLRTNSVPVLLR